MTAAALLHLPDIEDYTALIPLGFYGRISRDPRETKAGVERQEWEANNYVQSRNCRIVDHPYVDNDLSGYKRNIVRPEFEQLLADLRAGEIRGVVIYDMDRLTRQPIQLEYLIQIYEEHPDYVFYTVHGDLDLSTKQGKLVARFLVSIANDASAATSERLKDMHKQLARNGVPIGTRRMFGWRATPAAEIALATALAGDDEDEIYVASRRVQAEQRVLLDEDEADLIRQASKDIRGGVTRGGVVRDWNARGILNAAGNKWCSNSLRKMLLNPRIAGIRALKGKIVYNPDGTPVVGKWEAILPVDEWEQLCVALTDPARAGISHGRLKYFASGVLKCGVCGRAMPGGRNRHGHNFQCGKSAGGCGSVAVNGQLVEAWLDDVITTFLRDVPAPDAPVSTVWPDEAELAGRQKVRNELMERIVAGSIDWDFGWAQLEKLDGDVKRMTTERTAWLREQPVRSNETPATVLDKWPNMTVDQRRAIVQQHIVAVVVSPVGKQAQDFDPGRLSVVWRDVRPA